MAHIILETLDDYLHLSCDGRLLRRSMTNRISITTCDQVETYHNAAKTGAHVSYNSHDTSTQNQAASNDHPS